MAFVRRGQHGVAHFIIDSYGSIDRLLAAVLHFRHKITVLKEVAQLHLAKYYTTTSQKEFLVEKKTCHNKA